MTRRRGRQRALGLIAAAALTAAISATTAASPAFGDFPYSHAGADKTDFTDLYLNSGLGELPNDLCGDGNEFKLSASADPNNPSAINDSPTELMGVRGAHVADQTDAGNCTPPFTASTKPTGWKVTTGRPDVTISVLDSGIKWNEDGTMKDLAEKIRLNKDELPTPNSNRATPLTVDYQGPALDCGSYQAQDDANGDGVFNVADFACDDRIDLSDSRRAGPPGRLTPEDLIITFSDGTDDDANGFVDDIAGWDFLDDDNDPYDDVQYGHGTGEAKDSNAEANNGEGQAGACPSCTVIPLRVGDSFIADDSRFAAAAIYATDNGVSVIQEALGTLNNSKIARQAVDYAYRHGVTVIASAADEAAQHNNWPSSLPHVILVNSVRDNDNLAGEPQPAKSYLAVNGCTNFNSKITLAIPSTSCSSNATGLGAGMAGLVYSAALDAKAKGALSDYDNQAGLPCRRTNGDPCVITPNEVRQVMASGHVGGTPLNENGTGQSDDVDFAGDPAGSANEPSCSPLALPGCTGPEGPGGSVRDQVDTNRPSLELGGPVASRSYMARKGHDQYYGWGRVNMDLALHALLADHTANPPDSKVPPEVEITSPEWYEQVSPDQPTFNVRAQIWARGAPYVCQVLVAPGHYPNNAKTTDTPPGDFKPVTSAPCNGTPRSASFDGVVAQIDTTQLKQQFPPGTDFHGAAPGAGKPESTENGRPNEDPYGFTIKVIASTCRGGTLNGTTCQAGTTLTGEDMRSSFLHRDQDMLPGFPRTALNDAQGAHDGLTGDGESSPAFADLDGDNRNELIYGGSDGFVHAMRPDGSELPGWPVRTDQPGFLHTGGKAFQTGAVDSDVGGAVLAAVAVADVNHDGVPEVFAADFEGKIYGWNSSGQRVFTEQADPDWGGKPLQPFVNVRHGEFNRVQHGFIASPVLADLDRNDGGKLEVIAAGMDRHVYAWNTDDPTPNDAGGAPVDRASYVSGFPTLVVDMSKVKSIDPQTHAVTFCSDSNPPCSAPADSEQQGAIVDTPAVGNLDSVGSGDSRPEIVVGTNEEYKGTMNSGNVTTGTYAVAGALLKPGNGRLYAITPDGDPTPATADPTGAFRGGWPFAVGIANRGLLPIVGEGVTGYPVIGPGNCPSGGAGAKIGALSNNGPAYVLNPNATSCYGNDPTSGLPNALDVQFSASPQKYDTPIVPAVGLPAFGDFGGPNPDFFAPAAGLIRAIDVAASEYQGGQDFIAAWNTNTGELHPGFPAPVNDLQFLTGPSIADIDGLPGQEVVEGTASKDLAAFSPAGSPVSHWPKISTDWTVANPLIGTFGTLDTEPGVHKVVVGMTRSGYINAYTTPAPPCSASSWPRFHHDNPNSGDYNRDAVSPGRPSSARIGANGKTISFRAPGDDLLCGIADHYELVTSDNPITAANFGAADPVSGGPTPAAPGATQSFATPTTAKRYVAIRAVDDQGNVGRPASVDFGGGGPPPIGDCVTQIVGDSGDNVLTGTNASEVILGLGGNDRIDGRGAHDCIFGGSEDDHAHGGDGNDRVSGMGGADVVYGDGGNDTLYGRLGPDRLIGGPGRDTFYAGGGEDFVNSQDGRAETVDCGARHDTVRADRSDRLIDCETVHY
jgi:hypothetical protein